MKHKAKEAHVQNPCRACKAKGKSACFEHSGCLNQKLLHHAEEKKAFDANQFHWGI